MGKEGRGDEEKKEVIIIIKSLVYNRHKKVHIHIFKQHQ